MMKSTIFMLIGLLVLIACQSPDDSRTEKFIPGTYIRFSAHEYGKEYDTLVITVQNEVASEFQITRRWRYERVLGGQPIEPTYELHTTTGTYEKEKKLLQERETGNSFSFDPLKGLLYAGKISYQKIK